MQGRFGLLIMCLLVASLGFSQEIQVRGGFTREYFKVGEEVSFWMTARYPVSQNMILPDSLYDFGPFEYVSKSYYPSQLQGNMVYDTAIYTLQSFEIDQVQYLKLPGIVLKDKDSVLVYTNLDSLLLMELAPNVTDTTTLKTNVAYVAVDQAFNYPLFWIIVGILAVLLILTVAFFGKKILRAFRIRRMRKEYMRFSDYLTEQIRLLKVNPQSTTAEQTMAEWKKYVEKLEKRPFSKLTSKEILQMDFTGELNEPLRSIDKCVYGGQSSESIYKEFQSIEDFTQHRYGLIIEEIRNGK